MNNNELLHQWALALTDTTEKEQERLLYLNDTKAGARLSKELEQLPPLWLQNSTRGEW